MTRTQELCIRVLGSFCTGVLVGPVVATHPALWAVSIMLLGIFWGVFPFRALFGGAR